MQRQYGRNGVSVPRHMLCHLPGKLPSTPDGGENTDVSTPEEEESAASTRGGRRPEVSPLWPLMRGDEVVTMRLRGHY